MSERATRPIDHSAAQAADDELYANHASDPRPNALYDEDGNRKPLDANDPDQADLREEWMQSYKADGGQTEPMDTSGGQPDQSVQSCDQMATVDPLIIGTPVDLEDGDDDGDDADGEDDSDSSDDGDDDADGEGESASSDDDAGDDANGGDESDSGDDDES
jgi:hypothetical protein